MKRHVAEEAYQESLQTLSDWLRFLDGKEREIEAQMARLKKKGSQEGGGQAEAKGQGRDDLAWLDQGPPSTGDEAPAGPSEPPPPQSEPVAEPEEPDMPDWLSD